MESDIRGVMTVFCIDRHFYDFRINTGFERRVIIKLDVLSIHNFSH